MWRCLLTMPERSVNIASSQFCITVWRMQTSAEFESHRFVLQSKNSLHDCYESTATYPHVNSSEGAGECTSSTVLTLSYHHRARAQSPTCTYQSPQKLVALTKGSIFTATVSMSWGGQAQSLFHESVSLGRSPSNKIAVYCCESPAMRHCSKTAGSSWDVLAWFYHCNRDTFSQRLRLFLIIIWDNSGTSVLQPVLHIFFFHYIITIILTGHCTCSFSCPIARAVHLATLSKTHCSLRMSPVYLLHTQCLLYPLNVYNHVLNNVYCLKQYM